MTSGSRGRFELRRRGVPVRPARHVAVRSSEEALVALRTMSRKTGALAALRRLLGADEPRLARFTDAEVLFELARRVHDRRYQLFWVEALVADVVLPDANEAEVPLGPVEVEEDWVSVDVDANVEPSVLLDPDARVEGPVYLVAASRGGPVDEAGDALPDDEPQPLPDEPLDAPDLQSESDGGDAVELAVATHADAAHAFGTHAPEAEAPGTRTATGAGGDDGSLDEPQLVSDADGADDLAFAIIAFDGARETFGAPSPEEDGPPGAAGAASGAGTGAGPSGPGPSSAGIDEPTLASDADADVLVELTSHAGVRPAAPAAEA